MKWLRVTKKDPCQVCTKGDWCCTTDDGSLALCMRSESQHPSKGNSGGWIHVLKDRAPNQPVRLRELPNPTPTATIDAPAIWDRVSGQDWTEKQSAFAASLGLSLASLNAIGCAWSPSHGAWCFPMKDARGSIVGIRTRFPDGSKKAITGSRAGLFYCEGEAKTCAVCEGPTDTAAGFQIGLHCVGRPSCLGQENELVTLLHRKRARRVIIVCDNDDPGWRGAQKLSDTLDIDHVIWCCPAKDLREFVRAGGTKELIESLIHSLVWTVKPKTTRSNLGSIITTDQKESSPFYE